jgi:hypothetical protein
MIQLFQQALARYYARICAWDAVFRFDERGIE